MRYLVALLILMGVSAPSIACINDSELPDHEREFRSDYDTPLSPGESPESERSQPLRDFVLMGMGLTLLTGSVGLVLILRLRSQ